MITILCIDDTPEVQIMVRRTFSPSANVISAETLHDGYEKISKNHIDLILLDLTLPDGEGFQFFNKIKEDSSYTEIPIIILSAKNKIQDKVMGFHLGAEDYIVKPFDPAELKIRVETRIKRNQVAKDHESIFIIGNMSINHLEQKTIIQKDNTDHVIELTTTEFKILSYLCKHKDQVISREQIINSAWKHGFNVSDRTIDSHISRIRKKIADSDHNIQAIQGVGYKIALVKKAKEDVDSKKVS